MVLDTKAIGKMIKQTSKVYYSMPMGIFMKANGTKIKPMDMESTRILTVRNMKAIG